MMRLHRVLSSIKRNNQEISFVRNTEEHLFPSKYKEEQNLNRQDRKWKLTETTLNIQMIKMGWMDDWWVFRASWVTNGGYKHKYLLCINWRSLFPNSEEKTRQRRVSKGMINIYQNYGDVWYFDLSSSQSQKLTKTKTLSLNEKEKQGIDRHLLKI